MPDIFPPPIQELPEADIPIAGIKAHLSQAKTHQIIFMEFAQDVDLPEHAHAAQYGVVLEGKIELVIDGNRHVYKKGDRYFIPAGVRHSGKIHAGYADITFFNEPGRYSVKPATPK
jgi:quercetin dioxygenase-like cupin family protein